jgi:hypothetical protein
LSEKASVELFEALKHYKDTLDKLRTCFSVKTSAGIQKHVYEVLKSRDAVQKALNDKASYPGVVLTIVVKLDGDLKKQAKNIARAGDLAEYRASLNPSTTAWWWFFDRDANWFWSLLTILFIYATLAGMVYILPRLFRGGPDIWGALYSIVVAALTIPGVQSALQSLPNSMEQFIIKIGVPAYHLNKGTVISAIISCILVSYVGT